MHVLVYAIFFEDLHQHYRPLYAWYGAPFLKKIIDVAETLLPLLGLLRGPSRIAEELEAD